MSNTPLYLRGKGREFLEIYNEELRFLHQEGHRFAQEYPQVASQLSVSAERIRDPFVERLLEGTAFLTSRVQQRLDLEQAVFAEHMLARMAPGWLVPTPSMAVIALDPDMTSTQWSESSALSAGSIVTLRDTSIDGGRMEFTLRRDIQLMPLEIVDASYTLDRRAPPGGHVELPRNARSFVHLRLSTRGIMPLSQLPAQSLSLSFTGDGERGHRLLNLIAGQNLAAVAWAQGAGRSNATVIESSKIRIPGLQGNQSVLPKEIGELPGTALLREYFANPTLFHGVAIDGLAPCLATAAGATDLHLVIACQSIDFSLLEKVGQHDFHLFAAPAVNLYRKRCAPLIVDDRLTEQQIVVDRLRPDRYEVFQVNAATAIDQCGRPSPCVPLHGSQALHAPPSSLRYASRVRRRSLDDGREGTRTFFTLARPPGAQEMVRTILVDALVCQGEFEPSALQSPALELDQSRPARHVRFIGSPSRPRPAPSASKAWSAVQSTQVNPLALTMRDAENGAADVRQWLETIAWVDDVNDAKRIASVTRVSVTHGYKPSAQPGPLAWARDARVHLDISSSAHADQGHYLFARIIGEGLRGFADLNQTISLQLDINGQSPSGGAYRACT